MAKLTTAEFIEAIKELSVLELNELVKACEEEFGVSAAKLAEFYTQRNTYGNINCGDCKVQNRAEFVHIFCTLNFNTDRLN